MNRKNLTAAVLAGLAGAAGIVGSAQAVNINPDGLGQLLLYPYYTTNGGNQTVLSVVNTTGDAKAVKVRFLEGQNSREVLDFNLYLSEYDVWTAAIFDNDGTPTMVTADTSCTVPYIYGDFGGVQEFLPWALTDEDPDGFADVDVRGAEGHFEMIEMGTMIDEMEDDTSEGAEEGDTVASYGSAAAATHSAGTPAACDQLVGAWTRSAAGDGYWIDDGDDTNGQEAFRDMTAPTGGLFGGAAIVNVQGGTMYSYDARAIDGFANSEYYETWADNGVGADALHQEPGTILPSLDSGGNNEATIFLNGDVLYSADDGTMDRGVDAVSFVMMHDAIMNEYTTEAVVNANTEWVITFPTKQFYVHQQFLEDYEDFRSDSPSSFTAPVAPFTSTWTWVPAEVDDDGVETAPAYVDYPCEVVILDNIYDREEGRPGSAPAGPDQPPIVSPRPPGVDPDGLPSFALCFETQVIEFGAIDEVGIDTDGSPILGSMNTITIDNDSLGFEAGWLRLDLTDASADTDQDGAIEEILREPLGELLGLPVTGFAVQRFQNGFLGEGSSTLANYGGIFTHKGTRLTSIAD
jgi:hypothetical protein